MEPQRIIMNYTVSPSLEDMEAIAASVIETLPDEILRFCAEMDIAVEEMVDETVEQDMDIDDPFELVALFKNGKEISPGIEKKTADQDDVLILYRRAILDLWCESGEDLSGLIRQIMIEELGRNYDFSDDEIEEMVERHYQGLL